MHLLVRETHTADEDAPAVDLDHAPADVVFLSFSDSDLALAAAAWGGAPDVPTLRLANLARLRHPMSVDLYLDKTVARSGCVLIRLLGGLDYWRYGAEETAALCRARGLPCAIVPGCERDDPRLAEISTIPGEVHARLTAYFRGGGPANVRNALRLAAHLAGRADAPTSPPETVAAAGIYADAERPIPGAGRAAIVFYRAHLLAADTAPIIALADALAARGLAVRALYADSLKSAAARPVIEAELRAWRPAVVIATTAFSARGDDIASPLDAAGVPVLQAVLANAPRDAWLASPRGLGQTDLAMNVVLPELDGRLLTGAISFKQQAAEIPGLLHAPVVHAPDADGVALAADRAAGWARLAAMPRAERTVALVLSDYPGAGGQRAHAVGLDTLASLTRIVGLLRGAGYDTGGGPLDAEAYARLLCEAEPTPTLSRAGYDTAFATLPASLRSRIIQAWGQPDQDADFLAGYFTFRVLRQGRLRLAIQPDRGNALDRRAAYHDPDLPPRHGYVAFHLWLAAVEPVAALVQLGAHGTLEWLPGKTAALSVACAPAALLRGLPVIYPYIVNDPGEAAAAKRRLGAVTIGHLTPPPARAGLPAELASLERSIDEYAAADGLDRRRTQHLRGAILRTAEELGLRAEAGIPADADDADTLARLSAYLCDVKDMQIRDGLHVFGEPPPPATREALLAFMPAAGAATLLDASPAAEADALLAALDGRAVAPGPAGAPTRGRADVLPTGRNLYAVDPRAVPTRSALALAERAAEALLRRHMQDIGDYLRHIVLDLWGSTTMRTGGEDFGLALTLLGVRPTWDEGSARVSGFEIVPLALLDRPRVDVTLRISGLFRDAFPAQIALFDQAVRAVAARDEAPDWNPLTAAPAEARIYGPAPGNYGAGLAPLIERGAWTTPDDLGDAYIAASGFSYGATEGAPDTQGFARRLGAAEAYLHIQDHAETDLLDGNDQAAHAGGFAAASAGAALYHADTSRPDAPRLRSVAEEVARVVRGRAANPRWIAGMRRHGYRGAAEIARSVEPLFVLAASLPARFDTQFDLLFAATLGDETTDAFLRANNAAARGAMAARFHEAIGRGLWHPRSNSTAALLAEAA